MKTEIVVVGAGAIGLALAYELACRGHRVTLVERDRVPLAKSVAGGPSRELEDWDLPRGASSWAASGILPPANLDTATDPIDRLRGLSHRRFPELAKRLAEETGIDCRFRRCGGWYLSDSPGETASMVGMVQYWRELSIECQPVSLPHCAAREPGLGPWCETVTSAKAWWVPDESTVCTPRLMAALSAACAARGVTILDRHVVRGFEETDAGVRLRLHAQASASQPVVESPAAARDLVAERLAICGGVWSGLIDPALRLSRSLVPVRGQILLLRRSSVTRCGA